MTESGVTHTGAGENGPQRFGFQRKLGLFGVVVLAEA